MAGSGGERFSVIGGGFRVLESSERTPSAVTPRPVSEIGPWRSGSVEEFVDTACYRELELTLDRRDHILWAHQRHTERPSFTLPLLRDIRHFQQELKACYDRARDKAAFPVRHMVWGSRLDGVFNMGGDLGLFADLIRAQDHENLLDYAMACIDICYPNAVNMDIPVITVALVQGDCLGGGFEAALSSDVLIAERRAKFGLPEILFGLFPGMGAYSFLARRVGAVTAEEMIFGGKIYDAETLHEMGIVDALAEDDFGEETVLDFIGRQRAKGAAYRSLYKVRRRFNPVTYEELRDVAEIWVDAALELTDTDLKKMQRLSAAQERRRRAAAE